MKNGIVIGVVLIVLGVIALAYQGITYTTRQKVLDIGPIHATAEHEKTIPLPPIIGAAAILGGLVIVVLGARKG